MNYVDLAFIGVILLSALLALLRGFVREVLVLASWVVASFGSLYAYPLVQSLFESQISSPTFAKLAGTTALFVVLLIICSLVSWTISRSVHNVGLGAIDRSLGFAFGILRGLLVMVLIYMATGWIWNEQERPEMLKTARSLPLMEGGKNIVISLLPADMRDSLKAIDPAEDGQSASQKLQNIAIPQPAAPNNGQQQQQQSGYGSAATDALQHLLQLQQAAPQQAAPKAAPQQAPNQ